MDTSLIIDTFVGEIEVVISNCQLNGLFKGRDLHPIFMMQTGIANRSRFSLSLRRPWIFSLIEMVLFPFGEALYISPDFRLWKCDELNSMGKYYVRTLQHRTYRIIWGKCIPIVNLNIHDIHSCSPTSLNCCYSVSKTDIPSPRTAHLECRVPWSCYATYVMSVPSHSYFISIAVME